MSIYRQGNVVRVQQECFRQEKRLNEQLRKLDESALMFKYGRRDVTMALARLVLLFPLTSVEDIFK